MMWHQRADVVVVGTGVAGLVAALAAHRRGSKVMVLSKAAETATFYAQGGIAVVLPDTDDSVEAHVADTLAAGAGLCDPDAVRSIVADGYRAVAELVSAGARFDESSPGRRACCLGPVRNSSHCKVRRPVARDSRITEASIAPRKGSPSPAGLAVPRLPPMVPALRI